MDNDEASLDLTRLLHQTDKGDCMFYGRDVRCFCALAASQQHSSTAQLYDFALSTLQSPECRAGLSQP